MKPLKIVGPLLIVLAAILYTASAQTWSSPKQVINPNVGRGGDLGKFSKLIVVNGFPAIACYDAKRLNLLYLRAKDSSGIEWNAPVTVDSKGDVGQHLSIQVVNGKPAISYYDATSQHLKYVRAKDQNGDLWDTAQTVDAEQFAGTYTSLEIVKGYPAIAYYSGTYGSGSQDLKFVRATDPDGTHWGEANAVDAVGNVGQFASLKVVDGYPAIAYYDATKYYLKYVRSTDSTGLNWGIRQKVDTAGSYSLYSSLQVVAGYPAISFTNDTGLVFIRAINLDGSAWNRHVIVDTVQYGVGYTSLEIVEGKPAIAYYNGYSGGIKYSRAQTATGTVWGVSVLADSSQGNLGDFACLKIVNGNPAISYYDNTYSAGSVKGDLKFSRSSNATGNSSWGPQVTFDAAGPEGMFTSMQLVKGNPAISYYDATTLYIGNAGRDLKYVRATNSTGTQWGPPRVIDSIGNTGLYTSLKVVKGFPAVSYYNETNRSLKYIHATDSTGSGPWTSGQVVSNLSNSGQFNSLEVVQGFPAISYNASGYLFYVRSLDSLGENWSTPKHVNFSGGHTFLKVVNDTPSIACTDGVNLIYVRATDKVGATWGTALTIGPGIQYYGAQYISMEVVNGAPAITFNGPNGLAYVRADDPNGRTWGTPKTLDPVALISNTSLQVIDGFPAVAYNPGDYFSGKLKYLRATDSSGTGTWNLPFVLDSAGNTGQFPSMIPTGTGAAISYYNNSEGAPYFISTLNNSTISSHFFRSKQNGNWSDLNTWESSPVEDFSSGVVSPATFIPDESSNTVTVRSGHFVTVTSNISIRHLKIITSGNLVINNGVIITITQ